ncbi:RNA-directed DNA polymerase, eukaryota [Tanacetum coccineum]
MAFDLRLTEDVLSWPGNANMAFDLRPTEDVLPWPGNANMAFDLRPTEDVLPWPGNANMAFDLRPTEDVLLWPEGSKQQMGGAASYVSAVNGATPSVQPGYSISPVPALVLDDECIVEWDFSKCAMGRVKGFDSIPNLQSILSDEGFVNVKISYLGGLWVMFEFDKVDTKMNMMNHTGVNSWFQAIQDVTQDFVSDERVVWIDIEGIPLYAWSRKTFAKIGNKWGDVMNIEDSCESSFGRKRLCILTKHPVSILESFKIIVKGEEGELNGNEDDEVAETIFIDNSSPSMNHSVRIDKKYSADPFGLYDLLDKKTPTKQGVLTIN